MQAFRINVILLLLLCFSINICVFAQVFPKWGVSVSYSRYYQANENEKSDGYTYLLINNQVNIDKQEVCSLRSVKINKENGLSAMGFIALDYDSSYQRLDLNFVQIIRKGKIIDILKNHKPEILRREIELERGLIDGWLTCYLEVTDLRVGDILEYSYVRKGFNPAKKGLVFFDYNMAYSIPVGKISNCFVTKNPDRYYYKLFNGIKEPQIIKEKGWVKYLFEEENPAIVHREDNCPSWYNPFPRVFFYSKSNWSSLAKIISCMYALDRPLNNNVKRFISEVKKNIDSEEGRLRYVIDYVQNKIRYLGNENGIYGFKPRHPNEIMSKRSGDCKEKSLLLCNLIKELGYRSFPVLVDTYHGYILDDYPSCFETFNHCVCCFEYGSDTIFVDPTITNQGGKLKNIWFPSYYKGLIINNETKSLTQIPLSDGGKSEVTETYSIDDLLGAASLKVESVFSVKEAENLRSDFIHSSKIELQNKYMEFYANIYAKIDTVTMLSYSDSKDTNVFTTVEEYNLEDIWEVKDSLKPKDITTYFYARSLWILLNYDNDPQREGPFKLRYPFNYYQKIIVNLPENWNLENEKDSILGPGFEFVRNVKYQNNKLLLDFSYKSKKSFVSKEEYAVFIKKNKEVKDLLSYGIVNHGSFYDENSQRKYSPVSFIIALLTIIMSIILANKTYKYNLSLNNIFEYNKVGIGGWLVFPLLGLVITPVTIIISLYSNGYFEAEKWHYFYDMTISNYSAEHSYVILFEYILNISIVVFALHNLLLFSYRRSSFPIMMIVFYIAYSLFVILDVFFIYVFELDVSKSQISAEIFKSIIQVGIWVPYFYKSERVKKTFIRKYNPIF